MTTRYRLAELLDQRGMSQSELSRVTGIPFPTINRICLNKTKGITLDVLDRIASALGVQPGELFAHQSDRKGK